MAASLTCATLPCHASAPHMKALLFVLLSLPFGHRVHAQTPEKQITSAIRRVTVYRSGARITREAQTSLPAGTSTLVFTDITSALDPQSIQLDADGDFTVLSVSHRFNYIDASEPSPEVAALIRRKTTKEDSLQRAQAMLQVYQEEEKMLLSNESIGGTSGIQTAALKDAVIFFRERLTDVKARQLETQREINRLQADVTALTQQINELQANNRQRTSSQVVVTVASPAPTRGSFALSYMTPASSWAPHYNLRVADVGASIAWDYNADVQQSSGEDWQNVRLTLSTGDPARPGTQPELHPWRIGFVQPRRIIMQESDARAAPAYKSMAVQSTASGAVPVMTVDNATTIEFEITIPYTINSDGKPNTVKIQEYKVPASYEYFAAPRLDRAAFLTARITGWEQYHLLPGQANVFFGGTYVGEAVLAPGRVSDTLVVSLGRDTGISIERTEREDFTKRQFFGSKQTEMHAFDIAVRNNKRIPVDLVVQDQVPLSTDEQIDVDADLSDDGVLDEDTGIVTWRMHLPPGGSKTLSLRYSVSYPKDRDIAL